jgi:hypothetical protein
MTKLHTARAKFDIQRLKIAASDGLSPAAVGETCSPQVYIRFLNLT